MSTGAEALHANPYVGPKPFPPGSPIFGREAEIDDLYSLVASNKTVVLYAQSGAGKSSLLTAGLIPRLRAVSATVSNGLVKNRENYQVFLGGRIRQYVSEEVLGNSPNIYMHNVLCALQSEELPQAMLLKTSLAEVLARQRRKYAPDLDSELPPRVLPRVLVLDQFEELFRSFPTRWEQRADFFAQVNDALQADESLRILFAMREDSIANLDRYEDLLDNGLRIRYRLEMLRKEAALEAVIRPLAGTSIGFAEGVAQRLVDDLLRSPVTDNLVGGAALSGNVPATNVLEEFVEPVQLQVVCFGLFRDATLHGASVLNDDDRAAYGDVDQALRNFYESTLSETSKRSGVAVDSLRAWFDTKLITEQATRGLVFKGQGYAEGMPLAAVDVLDELHIIRQEQRGHNEWYELSHDRFVQPILRANDAWREKKLAYERDLQVVEKLRLSDLAKKTSVLAGALALVALITGVAGYQKTMAAREKTKAEVASAVAAQQQEESARSRKAAFQAERDKEVALNDLRAKLQENVELTQGLRAQKATALGEAAKALDARNKAETSAKEASAAKEEAIDSARDANQQKTNAELARRSAEEQSRRSLSYALAADSLQRHLSDPKLAALLAVFSVEYTEPHDKAYLAQPFADRHMLVTRQSLEALQEVLPQLLERSHTHTGCAVRMASAAADGRTVRYIHASGIPQTWRPADSASVLYGPTGRGTPLPGAGIRKAAPFDSGIHDECTHDLLTGVVALSPEGSLAAYSHLDHVPDPSRLFDTIGTHGEIRIVDSSTPQTLQTTLPAHWYYPQAIAFSPDDRLLVAASIWSRRNGFVIADRHALWRGLKTHLKEFIFRGLSYTRGRPARAVRNIAFARDSRTFAVAVEDGSVELWDSTTGRMRPVLVSGHDSAENVAFSPDGDLLAVAHLDGAVVLWNIKPETPVIAAKLLGHRDGVISLAFSPDGKRLVTGGQDQTIGIWELATRKLLLTLPTENGNITTVAFSTDGHTLISGSSDGTLHAWNFSELEHILTLRSQVGDLLKDSASNDDNPFLLTSKVAATVDAVLAIVPRRLTEKECSTFLHESLCPTLITH